MTERITAPMDIQSGDVWTQEAVASLIGQETTLRVGSKAYQARIVDAFGGGTGVSVTLEYDGPPAGLLSTYGYSIRGVDVDPKVCVTCGRTDCAHLVRVLDPDAD